MAEPRRLLDTDVVSYLMDRRPEAPLYLDHLRGFDQAVSFITLGELLGGARGRNWSVQRIADLERYVFAQHVVLPCDANVAREWGRLMATCSRAGFTPGSNDGWIAASALAFGCTLVARDRAFKAMARLEPRLKVVP